MMTSYWDSAHFASDLPPDSSSICPTGVLHCHAPQKTSAPDLHYWVTDVSCLEAIIFVVRRAGFGVTAFTSVVSRSFWETNNPYAPLLFYVEPI